MIRPNDVLAEFGFDPHELKQRYLRERDRRIRPDGDAQYVDLEGNFAAFSEDRFVGKHEQRRPIRKDVTVLVLGGGMAGLLTAVRLEAEGVKDFLIVEQAGDFGGTWYWNRYPGIRCDIESYIYMPLLEEVGTVPSEKYAHGVEIQAHCRAIGRKYDLYSRALFQTIVSAIRWSEADAKWEVLTKSADTILASHVIVSSGPLHQPKLPGIPGLGAFRGKAFHTSRWDYSYTGGNAYGGLNGLRDKRVALIGTGATSIQVMPHLAAAAKHLYLFQRTPSAVDRRNNRPTDKAWFENQKTGWQARRTDNFVRTLMGLETTEDLVNDCWTDNSKLLRFLSHCKSESINSAPIEEKLQLVDFIKMQQIRALVSEKVANAEIAERLKPWYNLLCKRPLFSDEYYEVFNQPNVTLVDTDGKGVERITEGAIIVAGVSYPVDCIVFATGFRVGAYPFKSGGYRLIGRNGIDIADRWSKGPRTVHGTKIAGFPNFQIVGTYTQASQSFNYTHVTAYQAAHAAKVIAKCLREGIRTVEVTEAAELKWQQALEDAHRDTTQFEAECTPSYFNNEGKKDGMATLLGGMYGGGPFEYIKILDHWLDHEFSEDTLRTSSQAGARAESF